LKDMRGDKPATVKPATFGCVIQEAPSRIVESPSVGAALQHDPRSLALKLAQRRAPFAPSLEVVKQSRKNCKILPNERRSAAGNLFGSSRLDADNLGLGSGFSKGKGYVRTASAATFNIHRVNARFAPCVDGSELARAFFTFAALVCAAMCSAFKCG
jgi:hypothetical protein